MNQTNVPSVAKRMRAYDRDNERVLGLRRICILSIHSLGCNYYCCSAYHSHYEHSRDVLLPIPRLLIVFHILRQCFRPQKSYWNCGELVYWLLLL